MNETKGTLIYGATGYTGKLIVEAAVSSGARPVVAGRRPDAVRAVAESFGLPWRCFDLEDERVVQRHLKDVSVAVLAAGPFAKTFRPVVNACLRTGTHYVDITGELEVIESIAKVDAEARRAGVVLLPGAGFDVVPTDCLAAHLKKRLPSAEQLEISIGHLSTASRGSLKTMAGMIGRGTAVRRKGEIVELARPLRSNVDFGRGLRPTISVSFADIATAWWSTGIPNISVMVEQTPAVAAISRLPRTIHRWMGSGWAQARIAKLIDAGPEGPGEKERAETRAVVVATVINDSGDRAETRLLTPEPYSLTATIAWRIAEAVGRNEVDSGYQTPSTAFGSDFILQFAGVQRFDR